MEVEPLEEVSRPMLGDGEAVKALLEGGAEANQSNGPDWAFDSASGALEAMCEFHLAASRSFDHGRPVPLRVPLRDDQLVPVLDVCAAGGLDDWDLEPIDEGGVATAGEIGSSDDGGEEEEEEEEEGEDGFSDDGGEVEAGGSSDDGGEAEVDELRARTLLADGWEGIQTESDGWTALMLAAEKGHEAVVRVLLEGGANPESAGAGGVTALMVASQNSHDAVVEALLEGGADPDATDSQGVTALMMASQKGHEMVASLLYETGADLNRAAEGGWTALILASQNGNGEVMNVLLKGCASIDQATSGGMTPLMWASLNDHPLAAVALLEWGADASLKDSRGSTALRLARRGGGLAARVLERCRHADPAEWVVSRDRNLRFRVELARRTTTVEVGRFATAADVMQTIAAATGLEVTSLSIGGKCVDPTGQIAEFDLGSRVVMVHVGLVEIRFMIAGESTIRSVQAGQAASVGDVMTLIEAATGVRPSRLCAGAIPLRASDAFLEVCPPGTLCIADVPIEAKFLVHGEPQVRQVLVPASASVGEVMSAVEASLGVPVSSLMLEGSRLKKSAVFNEVCAKGVIFVANMRRNAEYVIEGSSKTRKVKLTPGLTVTDVMRLIGEARSAQVCSLWAEGKHLQPTDDFCEVVSKKVVCVAKLKD
jgi:ankyrin repeat protein